MDAKVRSRGSEVIQNNSNQLYKDLLNLVDEDESYECIGMAKFIISQIEYQRAGLLDIISTYDSKESLKTKLNSSLHQYALKVYNRSLPFMKIRYEDWSNYDCQKRRSVETIEMNFAQSGNITRYLEDLSVQAAMTTQSIQGDEYQRNESPKLGSADSFFNIEENSPKLQLNNFDMMSSGTASIECPHSAVLRTIQQTPQNQKIRVRRSITISHVNGKSNKLDVIEANSESEELIDATGKKDCSLNFELLEKVGHWMPFIQDSEVKNKIIDMSLSNPIKLQEWLSSKSPCIQAAAELSELISSSNNQSVSTFLIPTYLKLFKALNLISKTDEHLVLKLYVGKTAQLYAAFECFSANNDYLDFCENILLITKHLSYQVILFGK